MFDFLDFLRDQMVVLAVEGEYGDLHRVGSIDEFVYRWLGIDPDALERERRAVLAAQPGRVSPGVRVFDEVLAGGIPLGKLSGFVGHDQVARDAVIDALSGGMLKDSARDAEVPGLDAMHSGEWPQDTPRLSTRFANSDEPEDRE